MEIFYPVEISFIESIWNNRNIIRFHNIESYFFKGLFFSFPFNGFGVNRNKPLFRDKRLHWRVAKITNRQVVFVFGVYFFYQPFSFHFFNNFFAGLVCILACKFSCVSGEFSFFINYLNYRKVVFLGEFKIDKTMCRCNSHCPCSFFHIRGSICNNMRHYVSIHPGYGKCFTYKVFVSFIFWVNNNCFV